MSDKYVPRLKEYYFATVRDELQKQFEYKNVNQIPKIEKIVVNMGVGEAAAAHRHPRPQVDRYL